jgi:hypothetical protein
MNCLVNYSVVLLLGVVSLLAGTNTAVPTSPGVLDMADTKPQCRHLTTQFTSWLLLQRPVATEAPKFYTIKAPEFYTTTNAAPSYYTDAPKY